LSTKIRPLVAAPGNPIGFVLAGGGMLAADKAFDADKRALKPIGVVDKRV
jgi:hypothetical protein